MKSAIGLPCGRSSILAYVVGAIAHAGERDGDVVLAAGVVGELHQVRRDGVRVRGSGGPDLREDRVGVAMWLEVDITEKVIHENPQESLKVLRQLADLGVLIALDDFGAGFFSLTYIREFPFRKIKIDRRFVSGLAEREDARTVLRALAKLGLGLGMNTTLEGIETKEQLDVARSLGCTEMQGYYFSAPKTAEEIQELFLRHAKPAA